MAERSAHVDTFARDLLPPREVWPVLDVAALPELAYPPRFNCAAELVDRWVERDRGDRPAIRFPGGTWTYRELMERANRIAHVLVSDLGLVPGNRVLLRGYNGPMMAAAWLAVLKAGGIVVATMPLLRARELAYVIDKAQIALALCDHRLGAELEAASLEVTCLTTRVTFGGDGDDTLDAMMRDKPAHFDNVDTAADDLAIIGFTSGTTGRAKGTMHFHRDILAACDCFPKYVLEPTADDIFIGSPPLAFTFGLGGILLFPLRVGASTVLLEQATPPFLLQGIQDYRVSIVFTAPTAYRAMTALVEDFDLSSLKKCVSAGEHLPLATFQQWRAKTGIEIIDGIGSTEMLHMFISSSGTEIRPGATGKPVPGYRAKIVDDEGNEVPVGQVGNLAVQGPTGCRYLDDVDRQRMYVKNGWNLPGDSYRMDVDGYFWYQARTDDMIVSSGYKISGPEVENALLEHACVSECGVVGVADEERGQVVKAFVVLREGTAPPSDALAKELQDFVKSVLAPYKYPRQIEFVDRLPRTETGKLQRFRLRTAEST
ncbi:MAG: benzoate-CoA ligase family protein [Gemmatimonadaceae bacterium]